MKKDTHPVYYNESKVACACGNSFITGSTLKKINIEICSACHPFYTGKQKLVDTAQRIEKFKTKIAKQEKIIATTVIKKKTRKTKTSTTKKIT